MAMKREAPWDRLDGYNLPIEDSVNVTSSTVQIADGNPMRVLLVVGIGRTAGLQLNMTAVISTRPDLDVSQSGSPGLAISTNGGPVVIDWRKFGPAVASPWYAGSSDGDDFTLQLFILQITAREWAGVRDFPSLIQQADDGYFRR